MAKKSEASEPSATPSKPQITFTEQDVQRIKAFGSFLLSKALFNSLSINDALQLGVYVQFMNQLTSKVEAHVLEVISIKTPEAK